MESDEIRYKILKLLEENPKINQRELAEHLGVSLGKANYCLRALVDVGLVKVGNFARSTNKLGYAYILTPKGLLEKTKVALRFLEYKQAQYIELSQEIERLKYEVDKDSK